MKSSYDKFPAISVPVDGDCRAVAGWEAIGAELRARCGRRGEAARQCVVCVDIYHGVLEDEVLAALKAAIRPDAVIETREANKTRDEVRAMLAADIGDDRVFAVMSHRRVEDWFDGAKVEAVKAICAALTPVFIYVAADVMGNWKLVFPIYGALAVVVAGWLAFSRIPDEREAVLFAKCSPVKCFPWCIGLSVLAVVGIFACPGPAAFLACVFVAALASANTFGICMGIALDRMPEKANEITALMVMAIAGGAALPPILGLAQRQAGCAGLVWVLLACLAYQAALAAVLRLNWTRKE